MKHKNIALSGTVPKSNRKIVKFTAFDRNIEKKNSVLTLHKTNKEF
jgi:hypothetical protein